MVRWLPDSVDIVYRQGARQNLSSETYKLRPRYACNLTLKSYNRWFKSAICWFAGCEFLERDMLKTKNLKFMKSLTVPVDTNQCASIDYIRVWKATFFQFCVFISFNPAQCWPCLVLNIWGCQIEDDPRGSLEKKTFRDTLQRNQCWPKRGNKQERLLLMFWSLKCQFVETYSYKIFNMIVCNTFQYQNYISFCVVFSCIPINSNAVVGLKNNTTPRRSNFSV